MKNLYYNEIKMDNKEFLIKTKKKLTAGRKSFICNDGIFNSIKVKKI